MNIFTTINPSDKSFETQFKALSSWTKYNIYSVNTKDEIEKISKLYPFVKFIKTESTYDYNGKKLIKLNAILDTIEKLCDVNSNVAIINSDIILNNKTKKSIFNKKYEDSLIIATRWEIDDDKIYSFNEGYDLFIFNTKLLKLFKNDKYVIGLPWWDFWIPVISIKAGLKVYHIKNQLIYHITHETNYDKDIWIKFGEYLYDDMMLKILQKPIHETVYSFCTGIKSFIEKNQINIKIK